jgi:hypothetical protein
MNTDPIFNDIAIMQSHIHHIRPEAAVRRWSSVECQDYQLPLIHVVGFLSTAVPPISRTELRLQKVTEPRVVIDIVRNSSLHSLLEYDETLNVIRYRKSVPSAVKEAIAAFLDSRGVVLAN